MNITELYQIYQKHPMITTDSRDCPNGSIFLALKGASFNGNKFAGAALKKGCAYAIVDEPDAVTSDKCILVDDCLQTFKDLAREHRRQFNIPVVGITGTNGKTTTKELVSSVLSERYKVMFTQGNYNNDVGVPKTLFRIDNSHDIAVVEMGASHPGDIKTLVETVEPTCGMITNVGKAHLQGFGSFEGVMHTKGELYDYLAEHNNLVFINADNPYLMEMAHQRDINRMVCYGQSNESEVWGEVISCSPLLTFRWRTEAIEWNEITTHLIGAYNIDNMLAAITIGLYFDISPSQINHALANYIPSNNRSQMEITLHNKLIVDAYNANPSSMMAALENFKMMQMPRKMVILGDMKELGTTSSDEHQKIADYLIQTDIEEVWLVGDEFYNTKTNFRKFHNIDEVKAAIAKHQPQDRCILIKGSNGTHLYDLPNLL